MNGTIIIKQNFRINKDKNIRFLCSCIEINKTNAIKVFDRDYNCEFKVMK